jgi:Tfp pilus tip-associated adhesin PilY1
LKDNGTTTPLVSFPGVLGSTAPKDYFFDGSIGVYQRLGSTWIYPAMRRGGRAVYAFDVTDPANPVLKWRRGCFTSQTTDDSNCSAGWSGIGQTWSKPTVAYLSGYVYPSGHVNEGNPKPILIFGGGYDTCEDTDSQTRCAGTSKGSQVWFVDADTGAIIRTYPVSASAPGDVALLTNSTGYATHVYASDTNGDVYRINVGSYDGATFGAAWSSNAASSNIVIAQLSEANHARKFMNGPDVVAYTGYNAVLLGSGDREHPLLDSYACGNYSSTAGDYVTNQFYMLKDTPDAYPGSPITAAQLTDVTSGTTTVTVDGVSSTVAFNATLIGDYGWKFNFGACEQAVNRPLTIAGTTYFGTNAPIQTAVSSCQANLGIAKGYAIDFLTGNPAEGNVRSAQFLGGGMPPSPVAGVVDVDGTKLPFIIGGVDTTEANASALQGSKVEINPTGKRYRVFWYVQGD